MALVGPPPVGPPPVGPPPVGPPPITPPPVGPRPEVFPPAIPAGVQELQAGALPFTGLPLGLLALLGALLAASGGAMRRKLG